MKQQMKLIQKALFNLKKIKIIKTIKNDKN